MLDQLEENENGLEEVTTTLPIRHYTGHHNDAEEDGNQRTPGKDIWKKELCTAGFE